MKAKNKTKQVNEPLITKNEPVQKEPCCCSSEATTSQPCHNSGDQEELIRKKAYELYEEKGYQPGCEQENWLQAEKEVCK